MQARMLSESTIDSEGLKGSPEVPPLCRETQSLGQQMLNAPFGINGLNLVCFTVIEKSQGNDFHFRIFGLNNKQTIN